MKQRIIIGITGGSGIPLALEVLKRLQSKENIETHLIYTRGALRTLGYESNITEEQLRAMADVVYDNDDIGAAVASGTFKTLGMIVVPCSMKTLAGINSGYSDNLLLRAADVTIKEKRKLVLATRECPLSPIHLRNMYELSQIGVEILPPVISYYDNPKTVEEVTAHIAGKLLDRFDLADDDYVRWS